MLDALLKNILFIITEKLFMKIDHYQGGDKELYYRLICS